MMLSNVWIASVVLIIQVGSQEHFPDWRALGGRPNEPTCVQIPESMSLCSDIGYDQMRLPNLLGHDTLNEAQQQSGSWVPLVQVQCHPYTKLFLCALFTPVCLDSQIYPCRSLCEQVQEGCSERMKTYGYEWPDMLRCDRFPDDNDMCIKPVLNSTETTEVQESDCDACSPVQTYENILDNFCRADFVVRTKIKRHKNDKLKLKKRKFLKKLPEKKENKKFKIILPNQCCTLEGGKRKYLIMGKQSHDGNLKPTFVMEWNKKKKILRDAVKMFNGLNCTDPNLFSPTADDGTIVPVAPKKNRRKRLRKQNKNKKRNKNRRKGKKNRKRKNKRNKKRKDKKNEPSTEQSPI